ncbi:hypothetical protein HDV00_007527 [Rhizophlyctis rosea]|nr:hypothetical protein HDV00_007527 [Rhizophlyctis rosea]
MRFGKGRSSGLRLVIYVFFIILTIHQALGQTPPTPTLSVPVGQPPAATTTAAQPTAANPASTGDNNNNNPTTSRAQASATSTAPSASTTSGTAQASATPSSTTGNNNNNGAPAKQDPNDPFTPRTDWPNSNGASATLTPGSGTNSTTSSPSTSSDSGSFVDKNKRVFIVIGVLLGLIILAAVGVLIYHKCVKGETDDGDVPLHKRVMSLGRAGGAGTAGRTNGNWNKMQEDGPAQFASYPTTSRHGDGGPGFIAEHHDPYAQYGGGYGGGGYGGGGYGAAGYGQGGGYGDPYGGGGHNQAARYPPPQHY